MNKRQARKIAFRLVITELRASMDSGLVWSNISLEKDAEKVDQEFKKIIESLEKQLEKIK